MHRFLFLLIVCCSLSALACKEYPDASSYARENPSGKGDGTDGHWLKSDRKHKTMVWATANEVNLLKKNGFLAYSNIFERADFYHWFQQKTESLGFHTKWAKLAAVTTHRLSFLLGTLPCITGNSNKEIKAFVIAGNELIFIDSWPTLQNLRFGKPKIDEEAKIWDATILREEQKLIHPFYLKLSEKSLNQLEKLLRKESFATKFFPGISFEGSLCNMEDVWIYGMKMMGYEPNL